MQSTATKDEHVQQWWIPGSSLGVDIQGQFQPCSRKISFRFAACCTPALRPGVHLGSGMAQARLRHTLKQPLRTREARSGRGRNFLVIMSRVVIREIDLGVVGDHLPNPLLFSRCCLKVLSKRTPYVMIWKG